jgi:hypothetical protein
VDNLIEFEAFVRLAPAEEILTIAILTEYLFCALSLVTLNQTDQANFTSSGLTAFLVPASTSRPKPVSFHTLQIQFEESLVPAVQQLTQTIEAEAVRHSARPPPTKSGLSEQRSTSPARETKLRRRGRATGIIATGKADGKEYQRRCFGRCFVGFSEPAAIR